MKFSLTLINFFLFREGIDERGRCKEYEFFFPNFLHPDFCIILYFTGFYLRGGKRMNSDDEPDVDVDL